MAEENDIMAHPGTVLYRYFMQPSNLSINSLARKIDVPPNRICAIVNGERSVTADTAMRLARFFKTTPAFWLHMQLRHDIKTFPQNVIDEINEKILPYKSSVVPFHGIKAAE